MPASFAGQPIALMTGEYESFLTQYHSLSDYRTSDLWLWEADGIGHLPLPSLPESDPVKIGTLVWPTGLTRCAVFHCIVGSDQLAAIRTALTDGSAGPADLVLEDGNGGDLSVEMYLLAARPLSQIDGQTQAHLLTLVDERYYLRTRTGSIESTPASWADLLDSLATQLGITHTLDTVATDYGVPSDRWVVYGKPLTVLYDAACNAIGHRAVRGTDGTYVTVTATTATADADTQYDTLTPMAGGYMLAGDLARSVPAGVKVDFPQTTGGEFVAEPYTDTVYLVDLALSGYGSAEGVADQVVSFVGELIYDGSNAAACTAYAEQVATDYYNWHLCDLDVTFPGIAEWTLTGAEDRVEWTYELDRISTRVVRPPLQVLTTGSPYGGPNSSALPSGGGSTSDPLVRVTALSTGGGEFSRRYTVRQVQISSSGGSKSAVDVSPTTTWTDVVELSNSLVPVSVEADPLQGIFPLHTAPDGNKYIIADEANYFPSGSGLTSGSGDDFTGSPRRLVGYTERVVCEEGNLSVYTVPIYQFGNGLITLDESEQEWNRYENCGGGGTSESVLCVEPILTDDPIPYTDFGLTDPAADKVLGWDNDTSSWVWYSVGSGTVTSVAAGSGLSGGTINTSGTISLNLSSANVWAAAQTFPNSSGVKILDTDASHTLGLVVGSNLSANRTLTITTGDANRTLTLTGDASVTGTNTGDQFTATTTDRLLGRDTAGSGAAEELTVGGGIEFTGSQGIQRSALTGDVTASAGSNTTTIAADAVTNAKAANMANGTIKGRSTAGTGDPEDLTGTQATALLDAFVQAGASAKKGLAPAPGATAHTNHPYYLGDNGSWNVNKGGLLAAISDVRTSETTTSTSYVDLTTTQHVTFTLDVTSDVLVTMHCNVANTSAGGNCLVAVDVDGTDSDVIQQDCVSANEPYMASGSILLSSLAAGSHTLKMQFRVGTGTGSFKWRVMKIERVA